MGLSTNRGTSFSVWAVMMLMGALCACQIKGPGSALDDAVSLVPANIPPANCPSGEVASTFVLTAAAADTLPPRDEWRVPPTVDDNEPFENPADIDHNLRLNICSQGEQFSIERIDFVNSLGWDLIGWVDAATVSGLDEALTGDTSGLDILVPFEMYRRYYEEEASPTNEGILIRGLNAHAVFAAFVMKDGERWVLSDRVLPDLVYGNLEFGDFAFNPCPGSRLLNGKYRFATITVEWWGCALRGTAGGATPDLKKLRITDTSPHLPDEVRGQAIAVELGEVPDRNFRFRPTHHSVCESFFLQLPHASYSWKSDAIGFGGGHCPESVEGAPARPDPDEGGTAYRHIYTASGQRDEGVSPNWCRHPIRRCEPRPVGGRR